MSEDQAEAAAPEVRAGQRIAKVMARAGVCSRRDAEAWIAEGRVSVNGEVLKSPAFNVGDADDVRVDGKPIGPAERTRLFLFHKPRGLVTTSRDPEGRPTVFSALPPNLPRVVAIGRLDINTEGLLLLTNDGGLARVLELPSTGWLRRYRVRAHGSIDQAALDRLAGGVTIDGVDYLGVEAKLDREQGANAWLTLGLREGKNREIKKILEHLGLAVNRLIRISFGPFELGDLPEGGIMEVRTRILRDQLGVKLAKEAGVNFDAPIVEAAAPPPERAERGARENRRPGRAPPGRPDRGARRGDNRFERDAAPRRTPPKPSTPERQRKHVSALRAEIAADAANAKAPRRRVERSATHDRKGRTVAVERVSLTGEKARGGAAAETRPKRAGRSGAGERGGRSFPSRDHAGRGDAFGAGRERSGERRERPPHSERGEAGRRPERSNAGRPDSSQRERRFDRSAARDDVQRRDRKPHARDGAEPQRERRFDRPRSGPSAPTGENRSARSSGRSHGPRPPRAGTRDEGRAEGRFRGSGESRPPRDRPPERRPRAPGKGPPKGSGSPRRPPRKP